MMCLICGAGYYLVKCYREEMAKDNSNSTPIAEKAEGGYKDDYYIKYQWFYKKYAYFILL